MTPLLRGTSSVPPTGQLTYAQALEIVREATKSKAYQDFPLGQHAAEYLRAKRKRLTASSYEKYEGCLDKLARDFPTLELRDLEPPQGTRLLEAFLDDRWGDLSPRTYNTSLSILKDFLKFHRLRGGMERDPTEAIEPARSRQAHRTTFSADQRRAIVAGQVDVRDRLALRLLLDYGLRKGALRAVQFKHFDHVRKRLTIFTKGEKVRDVPIPDPAFWHDLERHILDVEAHADHFLLARQKMVPRAGLVRFPADPMGSNGLHHWWYRCLANAGIVPEGTTSGEKMHKARHTAGQRVLDATGNLKAAQKLLGHASIQTTADHYTDWSDDQLADTLLTVLAEDDDA